jgi:hypothetical protein
MRLLYGQHYASRYEDIARLIPAESRVLDVCMGDARLYTDYLKSKNVDYLGLDINQAFVRHAQKKGVPARRFDLNQDALPPCDYIIMQGSLYQFIPNEHEILEKLLASARHTLIISEPVKNLSNSPIPMVSWLARKATTTQQGRAEHRFQLRNLHSLFAKYHQLKDVFPVAGTRELAGIFKTAA